MNIQRKLSIAVLATLVAITNLNRIAHAADAGPVMAFVDNALASANELSDEQRKQVRELVEKNLATVTPLVKQYVTETKALKEVIRRDVVDEAAIRAQSAKVGKVTADLSIQRAQLMKSIRGVLTSEQLQRLTRETVDERLETFLNELGRTVAEN